MAIYLSAEDARMIAEIEAKAASNKTSKGEAKALIKEIKDAAAKRKTPKFNSKGQTEAKKAAKKPRKKTPKLVKSLKKGSKAGTLKPAKPLSPKQQLLKSLKDSRGKPKKPEAEKPEAKKETPKKKAEAKKLSAESKTSTDTKVRRKKVNSSRGKPPAKTTVEARRSGSPKFGKGATPKASNSATPKAKPSAVKGTSTVGPAGERISPQRIKAPSKFLSKLGGAAKTVARFGGPLAALSAGKMLYDTVHPDEVKKRSGESKAGFGTKKKVAAKKETTTAKKETTTAKKETTTASSFGTAFRKAKDAGEKTFTWPKGGKSYSTATKDDVKASGSKNLREHENKKQGKKATSFGTAFAAAKEEGKKAFTFNGKSYSTKTK